MAIIYSVRFSLSMNFCLDGEGVDNFFFHRNSFLKLLHMKTEAGELIHLDFGFKTYEAMRESETEIAIFKMTK